MKTQVNCIGAMPQDEFDSKILPALLTIERWKLPDCIRKMEEAVARLLNTRKRRQKRKKRAELTEAEREARRLRRTEKKLEAAGRRNRQNRVRGSEYREYLQSELWQQIRAAVMIRDESTCKVCGDKATQVHHRRYNRETMDGATLKWLVAICKPCHQRIHFKGGAKLGRRDVERRLKALKKQNRNKT